MNRRKMEDSNRETGHAADSDQNAVSKPQRLRLTTTLLRVRKMAQDVHAKHANAGAWEQQQESDVLMENAARRLPVRIMARRGCVYLFAWFLHSARESMHTLTLFMALSVLASAVFTLRGIRSDPFCMMPAILIYLLDVMHDLLCHKSVAPIWWLPTWAIAVEAAVDIDRVCRRVSWIVSLERLAKQKGEPSACAV